MQPSDPIFHKPKSIIAAKNLLYASLFIGFISVIMRNISLGLSNNGRFFALPLTIIGFCLMLFLIKEVGLRKNWARIILLVFVFAKLPIISIFFNSGYKSTFLEFPLFVFSLVLQLIAILFLFQKESNAWFKKQAL
jgi:hypothetical protein